MDENLNQNLKIVKWTCKLCGHVEKLALQLQEAPFTPENGVIEGMCELCLDAYRTGGLERLEKRRAAFESGPASA